MGAGPKDAPAFVAFFRCGRATKGWRGELKIKQDSGLLPVLGKGIWMWQKPQGTAEAETVDSQRLSESASASCTDSSIAPWLSLACALLVAGGWGDARAATVSWTGGSGDWNTATNWSTGALPGTRSEEHTSELQSHSFISY